MSEPEITPVSTPTVTPNGHLPTGQEKPSRPKTRRPKRAKVTWRARLLEMNKQFAMITEGPNIGSILVESTDPRTGWPTISFASTEQLFKRYANKPVEINHVWHHSVDRWLSSSERRDIKGIVFAPGQEMGADYYNLWRGFSVKPKQGDCSLYLQHIHDVIASGNDEIYRYVIAWMADAVQHPAQRPGISLALRGLQGTGKGVFISQFGKLFGPHYKHVTHSHHLVGRFNNHFKDALIVFADETVWIGDRKAEGVLKAMVTEETMQIEPKGRDIYEVQNHIRLMVASNKDWVVPAGLEERRFCVIDVPDTHIQDEAYFKAIVEEMDHGGREALLYHLLNEVDLSNIKLRNFPRTPALFEQMVRTMEPVQRFWYNMLRRGAFYDVSSEDVYTDWPGEVRIPCPTLYEKYGDYLGKRRQKLSDTDGGEAEFGSELRKWVPPEFKRYRPSNGHGGRVYTYVIPPLAACRAFFQEKVKAPITWPSAAEDAEEL